MKRLLATLIVILSVIICNAQPNQLIFMECDTLNQVNSKGEKFGYWQHYYFNTDWEKVITSSGYYAKNKRIGTWYNHTAISGIFKKDTVTGVNETLLIYNKGQYITTINFDSTQILHFNINAYGERIRSDKCVKESNYYKCTRYSLYGIQLHIFDEVTFIEAVKKIFD
jgi:hypothetical protein